MLAWLIYAYLADNRVLMFVSTTVIVAVVSNLFLLYPSVYDARKYKTEFLKVHLPIVLAFAACLLVQCFVLEEGEQYFAEGCREKTKKNLKK
eukprot:g11262.t1